MDEFLDILKACRRSRVKVRVYRGLIELKVALVAELAVHAQTTPRRVRAVLHGDEGRFRRDTSLIRLDVARRDDHPEREAYRITSRGDTAWQPVMARLARTRGPPWG